MRSLLEAFLSHDEVLSVLAWYWERFFLATPVFTSMIYKSVRERDQIEGSSLLPNSGATARMTFLEWYEDWLDTSLQQTLTKTPPGDG